MAADPTLQLTFGDMIIRVAEYLGIAYFGVAGTSAASVPVDAHDLDLCKRLINDGYSKFVTANTRWRFLTPNASINLVAATSVYSMPDGFFGSAPGPFVPPAASGKPVVTVVPESYIRQMNASGSTGGDPQYIAFRPKSLNQDNTSVAPRWEAEVWPAPTSNYAITAPIRLMPGKLVNLTDTPIAGFQHSAAILAMALAEAERQRDDKIGPQAAHAAQMLAQAKLIDGEAAPRRRGYNGDESDGGKGPFRRRYTGVDTYNGAPV